MRRVDRAIFAIFLLALVADVARSYASTPVSAELPGSLIFSAASQYQNGNTGSAVPASRRGYATIQGKRVSPAPVFASWSSSVLRRSFFRSSLLRTALFPPSAQLALLQPGVILAPQSAYGAEFLPYIPTSSLARIERAGNPAP